ncbi:MAG TPA: DNA-3-methyladenine glycosylase [Solirubrobacterales bacterium]|nr:DNA-3-methyladenine glycosylase [Solirubrobacterales bacterium]
MEKARAADKRPRPAGAHARPAAATLSAPDEYLRRADPVLRGLIDASGPIDPETDRRGSRPDPFEALARAIVGQQLSTKAARSIWERVVESLDGRVAPAKLIAADPADLRAAGLSNSKVAYLRDLSERVESGDLDLERIAEVADEDVVAELIEIKGIGRWTAEMFLIFHLARPDVISTGDLGIRRATQLAYGLDELPGPTDLERIAEPWRPHRTLACLYLWRSLQNAPA